MKFPTLSRYGKAVAASLLVCALAPAVHAWNKPDAPPPAAAAKAPPTPLLWKVSDADNAIWILGSFHLLKTDDYPLSSDIDQAFEKADKLVFEIPPAEMTDPALAAKMQELAGYSDGRSLSQVLPADVREKMGLLLGSDTVARFEPIEPWFINLSLLIGVSQQLGFRVDQGLDLHLARRAEAAGKPVSGLETAEQQFKVLDGAPMDEQVAALSEFVANPREATQLLNDTHLAWRNADVAKLESLAIDEMKKDAPETYRTLNVERNNAWVPQLQQMLDGAREGDTLVVIGAMHLLGADGVVARLQEKGYKVERICSACTAAK